MKLACGYSAGDLTATEKRELGKTVAQCNYAKGMKVTPAVLHIQSLFVGLSLRFDIYDSGTVLRSSRRRPMLVVNKTLLY